MCWMSEDMEERDRTQMFRSRVRRVVKSQGPWRLARPSRGGFLGRGSQSEPRAEGGVSAASGASSRSPGSARLLGALPASGYERARRAERTRSRRRYDARHDGRFGIQALRAGPDEHRQVVSAVPRGRGRAQAALG